MNPGEWLAAVADLLIAAGLIELVRRRAGHRLLDIPNDRSSHHRPTPRGGGLGIILGAFVPWVVWSLASGFAGQAPWALLAAVALVAVVSWFDDLKGLRFAVRLLIHLIAAIGVTVALGPFTEIALPGLGLLVLGWLGWPLTILWIVGLTNAYNFMDGIDGIAGGQGVVAGLTWWILGSSAGDPNTGILGLLLAVGCAIFLGFNWPPARIFMGDVGSATLGFAFATLPLLVARDVPGTTSWVAVAGVAVVWPFVFDASFTFLRRWRRGENVFAAHRSHLYQRMVIAGWSHRRVSVLYIGVALVSAVVGGSTATGGAWSGGVALGVALVSAFGLWRLTVGLEQRADLPAS